MDPSLSHRRVLSVGLPRASDERVKAPATSCRSLSALVRSRLTGSSMSPVGMRKVCCLHCSQSQIMTFCSILFGLPKLCMVEDMQQDRTKTPVLAAHRI